MAPKIQIFDDFGSKIKSSNFSAEFFFIFFFFLRKSLFSWNFGSVCIKLFNQICRVCAQRWRFLHHCTDGKTRSSWNKCFYFFHSNSSCFPINKMAPFLLSYDIFDFFFRAIFSTLLHLLKSRAIGVKESLFVSFLSPFPKDRRTRTQHTQKSMFCILHDSQKCIGYIYTLM